MKEFIRTKGVTTCPAFGSPEFREMNIKREKTRGEENSRNAGRWAKAKAARLQQALRS